MSRSKIINQLKKKNPNINQAELETALNIFCKSIEKALINEKTIKLKGFGYFFVKKRLIHALIIEFLYRLSIDQGGQNQQKSLIQF